jgi:general secretion pathway protein I
LKPRGFTLLEVMVAVAILGLSLTVILSSQAGLYSGASHAERTSVAIGLARCRMTELEEHLLKFGFPIDDEKDDGPCCDDESQKDVTCSWRVETIELPEPKPLSLGSDGALNLGLGGPGQGPGAGLPGLGPSGGADQGGSMGPLSTLNRLATAPQTLVGDGGVSSFASTLREGTGGVDAIAQLVMTFVYPKLKPMLEASIRKLTVTVTWREGIRSRDFSVVQYVTHPTRPDLLTPAGSASGAIPMPGTTATTTPIGGRR